MVDRSDRFSLLPAPVVCEGGPYHGLAVNLPGKAYGVYLSGTIEMSEAFLFASDGPVVPDTPRGRFASYRYGCLKSGLPRLIYDPDESD